ncbi:MAG: 2-amino-4-hydroxy-6-hydroxymethyldihydropteridine diphosphokinase [Chryseolinea sp.]
MINQSVYLLLGSNMGDRRKHLNDALWAIETKAGVIRGRSSVYETAAWGKMNQAAFYNQAVRITSFLTPQELLATLQLIEKSMGRERKEKWGERVIDIDILFYGDQIVDSPDLKIPHPELQNRRFALIPMAEIADDLIHPKMFQTIHELLKNCQDTLAVKKV